MSGSGRQPEIHEFDGNPIGSGKTDKTLLKGLTVLEHLAQRGESASIDEVADRLGLTRSNAHRTLQTLVHADPQSSTGQSPGCSVSR